MIHSVFTGLFGGDHWYAGNYLLAAFKLITLGGMLVWAIVDVVLWVGGGNYYTQGCGED
jgi:hypothetical protein